MPRNGKGRNEKSPDTGKNSAKIPNKLGIEITGYGDTTEAASLDGHTKMVKEIMRQFEVENGIQKEPSDWWSKRIELLTISQAYLDAAKAGRRRTYCTSKRWPENSSLGLIDGVARFQVFGAGWGGTETEDKLVCLENIAKQLSLRIKRSSNGKDTAYLQNLSRSLEGEVEAVKNKLSGEIESDRLYKNQQKRMCDDFMSVAASIVDYETAWRDALPVQSVTETNAIPTALEVAVHKSS